MATSIAITIATIVYFTNSRVIAGLKDARPWDCAVLHLGVLLLMQSAAFTLRRYRWLVAACELTCIVTVAMLGWSWLWSTPPAGHASDGCTYGGPLPTTHIFLVCVGSYITILPWALQRGR